MSGERLHHLFDAYTPSEIARRVLDVGVAKARLAPVLSEAERSSLGKEEAERTIDIEVALVSWEEEGDVLLAEVSGAEPRRIGIETDESDSYIPVVAVRDDGIWVFYLNNYTLSFFQ